MQLPRYMMTAVDEEDRREYEALSARLDEIFEVMPSYAIRALRSDVGCTTTSAASQKKSRSRSNSSS
jgi:hypothetical protein